MLLSAKQIANRFRQRVKSAIEGRRTTVYNISDTSEELTVNWLTIENETGEDRIKWNDVVSVYVFKRDLFAVDCICILFELSDGTSVEINEEMQGWGNLVDKLPQRLPDCKNFADWFETVAFPAFEINVNQIYQRKN